MSSARQLSWLPATGSISPAMGIFSALLTLAVAPFAGQIYYHYYCLYPVINPPTATMTGAVFSAANSAISRASRRLGQLSAESRYDRVLDQLQVCTR